MHWIPWTPRLVSFAVYFWKILQLTKNEKSPLLAPGYPWLRILSFIICVAMLREFLKQK